MFEIRVRLIEAEGCPALDEGVLQRKSAETNICTTAGGLSQILFIQPLLLSQNLCINYRRMQIGGEKMGGSHKKLFGLFLILFGLYYFLSSLGFFTSFMVYQWAFILLILSGGFHIAFFLGGRKKEKAGLLVPGGVFFVLGLLFIFETAAGWNYGGSTWPVYLLAAAFGLFELWLFGGRKRELLVPICVLSAIGVFFAADYFLSFRGSFWPLAAIVLGLYYVFRKNNLEKPEE